MIDIEVDFLSRCGHGNRDSNLNLTNPGRSGEYLKTYDDFMSEMTRP